MPDGQMCAGIVALQKIRWRDTRGKSSVSCLIQKKRMRPTISPGTRSNAYLQQFQLAQLNLAKLIEEERLLKRIKKAKKRTITHD
jgi:hypothetical protein